MARGVNREKCAGRRDLRILLWTLYDIVSTEHLSFRDSNLPHSH